MELKDYLGIIRRRWVWFLLFFPVFLGLHYTVFYTFADASYTATSRVVIALENYSSFTLSGETRLANRFLTSIQTKQATITEDVVLELAARLALGEAKFDVEKTVDGLRAAGVPEDAWDREVRDRVAAIQAYRQSLVQYSMDPAALRALMASRVRTQKQELREIVDIRASASSMDMARAIVDCVAEAAVQYHREAAAGLIERDIKWVNEKIRTRREQLKEAGRRRLDYIQEFNVFDFAAKEGLLSRRLQELETLRDQLDTDRQALQGQLDYELNSDLNSRTRSLFAVGEIAESDRVRSLHRNILETHLDLDNLQVGLSGMTDMHPLVQRKRAQLDRLERELDEETGKAVARSQMEFSSKVRDIVRDLVKLDVKSTQTAGLMESKRKELAGLNSIRAEFQARDRDFNSLQEDTDELAKLASTLDRARERTEGPISFLAWARKAAMDPQRGRGNSAWFFSGLLAFIVSLMFMYFLEYIDTRVTTEYDVRRHLNLPILGIISMCKDEVLLSRAQLRSPVTEEFSTAATMVRSACREHDYRSVLVCSTNPKEGKTTVALNTAISMARKGMRVVLIDADLRIPQVHALLGLPNAKGLSNLLSGGKSARTIVADMLGDGPQKPLDLESYLQRTSIPNLRVLTSGPSPEDPVAVLESRNMQRLLETLREETDFVVIDTPPISKIGDALALSAVVDACLFVVGSGLTEQYEVTWTKHLLNNVQANIIGVVLNMATRGKPHEYYYYYSSDVKSLRERS